MTNKPIPASIREAIPDYWGVPLETEEDLLFCGKPFLRHLIQQRRSDERNSNVGISYTQHLLNLLDGTDGSPTKLAERYEDPTFPRIALSKGDGYPVPVDAASINRAAGRTTFNVCGWCKYNTGGGHEYGYSASTMCEFEREEESPRLIPAEAIVRYQGLQAGTDPEATAQRFNLDGEYPGIRENADGTVSHFVAGRTVRRFYTPCLFRTASPERLRELQDALQRHLDEQKVTHRQTRKAIRLLMAYEKQAEQKPALPDHRPKEWFKLNDPVVGYIGSTRGRVVTATFVRGQVIRDMDGYTAMACFQRIQDGNFLEGYGLRFGSSRPEVMHPWELDYLRDHPDFAKFWLNRGTSKHLKDHDPEAFARALADRSTGPAPAS